MREVPEAASRLWDLLTRFCGANASGTWWGPQSTMVAKLGIPLRTLQRRLKLLVDAGLVKVRRFITDWGYRHMNIYTIPALVRTDDALGRFQDQSGASKVVALSSKEENHLTVVQSPTEPLLWHESDRWLMTKPKRSATTGQLALDFGQSVTESADQLDGCTRVCDTSNRRVSPKEGRGTPASRSVSYWLSGRNERPPAGVIAGVAKAIKTCFEQDRDLSEPAMHAVIDSLMRQGLDASPRQFLVAFGLQKRSRTVRKPGEVLFQHRPKRSTMTRERAAALSQAASARRNATSTATAPKPQPRVWHDYDLETPSSPVSSPPSRIPGVVDKSLNEATTGGLDFGFLKRTQQDTTYPWWLNRNEWTWEKASKCPPASNGDPRYASVTPPPEAGYGPGVRIDVLKPPQPETLGDSFAAVFAKLGIALSS